MKASLIYDARGVMLAVRRPIGFHRPVEWEPARSEEWSANAPDQAVGSLVGWPAYNAEPTDGGVAP